MIKNTENQNYEELSESQIFEKAREELNPIQNNLIERKITDNNFDLEQESKNLELLKLKFGENLLTNC